MATVGGITEVDGNSLEIEALARFAVDEHNKSLLVQFESVEKAKQQVVAGMLYYLTIKAVVGGKKQVYQAKVVQKPGTLKKELLEFKHLLLTGDAPSGPSA